MGGRSAKPVTEALVIHVGVGAGIDDLAAADEDVEWLWTETAAGRYVSGYRLISRINVQNTVNVS